MSKDKSGEVITPSQMDKMYADSYDPDWKPGGVSDGYRKGYDRICWDKKRIRRTKSVHTR